MGVLIAYSSSAHRNLDLLPTREVPDRAETFRTTFLTVSYGSCAASWPTARRSPPVSSGPWTLRALGNARRRTASSRQAGVGCTYAPRPGSVPRRSGTQRPSTSATRSSPSRAERCRQPTQVRSGQTEARVRLDTDDSTSPCARPQGAGPLPTQLVTARPPPVFPVVPRHYQIIRRGARSPRAARSARCPAGYRSASRSAGPRAARSGLPCRSPATADSPARSPGRTWPPGRPRPPC